MQFLCLIYNYCKSKKPNKTIKICLCSDITNLNEVMIKNARPIPYQQIVFNRIEDVK